MCQCAGLLACLVAASVAAALADQDSLPAPLNVSMVSINMKHWLTWNPVVPPVGNVTYSLQVQGEFERIYWKDSWSDVAECISVAVPRCDVTEEIKTNVFYNLRVRAELGAACSQWATLEHPFNRDTTLLTPPMLKVKAEGRHLVVEMEELGPAFQLHLVYWSKENEHLVQSKTVKESRTPFHLDTVEAGMEYCVKAQTYVLAIHRYSNFSSPACIAVSDTTGSVLAMGLLSLFAFILAIIILPILVWKAHQMLRYSCCPKVIMPQTLTVTDSPRKLICPKSPTYSVEECAMVVGVDPVDERHHLWMQKTL
ncbi:interleukin-20 receptor subunit beta [Ambystoma mexicanum]|uniref:interleukin-20 receptor subunit beta n=1 Tax=Ambystoma mexicanum TaxID=8296 RepID=UPI0037E83DD6